MDFESKITCKEINRMLWEMEKTVGTAESCTGGRISEALISSPGASKYFRGGIVSYADDVKETLLGVSHETLIEKTAVCEEVAKEMVLGACRVLKADYAIASTGWAGPTGGSKDIPVGTIWIACGSSDNIKTVMIREDHGRDINLAIATKTAINMFFEYLKDEIGERIIGQGKWDNSVL